jgi:hypothetical protein
MLAEAPARARFFEREQYERVLAHLSAEIRPVIQFAYITGWRIAPRKRKNGVAYDSLRQ